MEKRNTRQADTWGLRECAIELKGIRFRIGHLTNTEIGQVSKQETPQMRDAPEEFFFYTETRLRLET